MHCRELSGHDKQTIKEIRNMTLTYEEIIAVAQFLTQRELDDWTKGRIKGRIEGQAWGKIDNMKDVILSTLSIRFSSALAAKAQPVVMSIQGYETLNMLFRQLIKAPNEQFVCLVLDLPDEQSAI